MKKAFPVPARMPRHTEAARMPRTTVAARMPRTTVAARMPRTTVAAIVALLALALGACTASRVGLVRPDARLRIPTVLASLGTGTPDAAFSVDDVGPTGTVAHENLEGGVWVLFNKPVIGLKTLEKPATSSTILTISPRVDGIYRWYGSRLFAFEPKGQLAPATEYTFTVNPSLRSLAGDPLTGTTRFSFRTEPFSIVSLFPSGDDVEPASSGELIVTFNFPVDLPTILPFIRLEADGDTVAFKAARPQITSRIQLGPYEDANRLVSLTPVKALPRDSDIVVRVLKGAKPRPENFGTSDDITQGFHTLLPLSVEQSDVSMGRVGATVELQFNHPVKEETVAANLHLPFPGYDLGRNLEVSGSWVFLHDVPVAFESTFEMTLGAGIEDTYGQSLGADQTVKLEVGPAEAYVDFRSTGQRILEAQFPPRVAIEMQNIDSGSYVIGRLGNPYATPPKSPVVRIDAKKIPRNTRHFQVYDLAPYLNDAGRGTAFLSWAFKGLFWGSDTPQDVDDQLVVQVTDIGASVSVGYNSILVLASSLSSGAPITDAVVTLRKDGKALATGQTDAKGLAAVSLPPGGLMAGFQGSEEKAEIEIARGKDRLILRPHEVSGRSWNSEAPYAAENAKPLTYIWSDRGIYRPGETLSFAGIDRNLTLGRFTAVPGKFRVDLSNGSEDATAIASATGTVTASGSFSGQMVLPKSLDPGDWLLAFHRIAGKEDTRTGMASVQVANFRRVTFGVDLTIPDTRFFIGDSIDARFTGTYLAGGTIAKGTYNWFWTRRETWYQPPGDNWASYTFGDVEKGWAEDLTSDSGSIPSNGVVEAPQKLGDTEKGRVYTYELVATVQDIDRQAISKRDTRTVFSSAQQLGAKLTSDAKSDDSLYFVTKAAPFTLKVVSVDPDGKVYPSSTVSGSLIREDWKLVREAAIGGEVDTRYERQDAVEKTFTVSPKGAAAAVQLATQKSGSYRIELTGKDQRGRESFTRLSFYATGSDEIAWQRTDERQVEIVPDKKLYAPGDIAHLLIKSPVSRGTWLVSVERDGVLDRKTVDLAGGAPTIDIPITTAHIPIVYVFVATATGRTQPPAAGPDVPDFGTPRGYSGLVELPVEASSKTIALKISNAQESYRPGSQATVTITATMNGKPVQGAEIALVAADRGVLDLIDYRVPDPVDFFYSRGNFPDKVAHYDTRDMLMDPVTWKANDLPGGDEKLEEAAAGPGVSVRRDFNPTAVFRTGLITGKDGRVSATFKLPDSLTRFRETAVAVKDDSFGIAEGELVVQNPVNVRAALPRRMRVDDTASAGVVLTNIDTSAHTVAVSLSVQGLDLTGPQKKSVALKAGETAEVAFDMKATAPGTAKLSFGVDSDVLKERLDETLVVAEEHLSESFTIVGKTTDLAKEGITVPPAFLGVPEEGLYLSLDSTIASSLAGAIRYLDIYPYDCLEQVTSKLFARVLFPTIAGGAADLTTLTRFANPDGGFSYWDDPPPRRSNYYVSLRVAHLLAAAKTKGIAIPAELDTDALLSWLDAGWADQDTYLKAYALYVLASYGRAETEKAAAIAALGDKAGVFGYGFLGLSYQAMGNQKSAQAVLTRLKNFIRIGTRTVTLVGTVNDWLWYGGDLQAKSLLLMLFTRLQPDSPLVLGLANDLLAANSTGHWENTSNAGWVLQAFSEVVTANRETQSDFTASVKLGGAEIAGSRFKGFSKTPYARFIPAQNLGAAGAQLPLTFGLSGKGTLYYTAELRYALSASGADPRDEGIGIETEILDDAGAIVSGTDLTLGKVYTMRVVFYSSKDRTFFALRAPLPSGAEPIDGSLVTSQVVKPPADSTSQDTDVASLDEVSDNGYTSRIYDSEVRFFFDQLDRGRHDVSFLFRATTPGVFPTPPVQAELMYQPEVFGRTGGAVYRIAP